MYQDRADFADAIAARLKRRLPGREGQRRFEPELSYGRHYAPPLPTAREAAVVAVCYPVDGDWRLPLIVRPTTMRAHAGQVALPGGMVEPDETSQIGAMRELEEELGISAEAVRVVGRLSTLNLFVTNFVVTPWVAVLDARPEIVANPAEVEEWLEVRLADLADSANYGCHQQRHRGLEFTAPHIACRQQLVWGATSMILGEFISVINNLDGGEAPPPETTECNR